MKKLSLQCQISRYGRPCNQGAGPADSGDSRLPPAQSRRTPRERRRVTRLRRSSRGRCGSMAGNARIVHHAGPGSRQADSDDRLVVVPLGARQMAAVGVCTGFPFVVALEEGTQFGLVEWAMISQSTRPKIPDLFVDRAHQQHPAFTVAEERGGRHPLARWRRHVLIRRKHRAFSHARNTSRKAEAAGATLIAQSGPLERSRSRIESPVPQRPQSTRPRSAKHPFVPDKKASPPRPKGSAPCCDTRHVRPAPGCTGR
jgi:hypothetical protein